MDPKEHPTNFKIRQLAFSKMLLSMFEDSGDLLFDCKYPETDFENQDPNCVRNNKYSLEVVFQRRMHRSKQEELTAEIGRYNDELGNGLMSDQCLFLPLDRPHSGRDMAWLQGRLKTWLGHLKTTDSTSILRDELQEIINFSAAHTLSHGEIKTLLATHYGFDFKVPIMLASSKSLEEVILAIASEECVDVKVISLAAQVDKILDHMRNLLSLTGNLTHIKFAHYQGMMRKNCPTNEDEGF